MTQMSADKIQSSFQRMLESSRKHYSLLMKEGWFTGFPSFGSSMAHPCATTLPAQEWREILV